MCVILFFWHFNFFVSVKQYFDVNNEKYRDLVGGILQNLSGIEDFSFGEEVIGDQLIMVDEGITHKGIHFSKGEHQTGP